jgi:uncharacterized protein YcbK (DUF882 family)
MRNGALSKGSYQVNLADYQKSLNKVTLTCQLDPIDMGRVRSFVIGRTSLKSKENMLEKAIGNLEAVKHYLRTSKEATRLDVRVARMLENQWKEVASTLEGQVYDLYQIEKKGITAEPTK